MTIQDDKLSLVEGNVVDSKAVEQAVEGSDLVISALGPTPDANEMILAKGTENIINAMKKNDVKRLIVESSCPLSGSPEGMAFLKGFGMTDDKIASVRPMIDDKIRQETIVRKSGLDWTIVRPLALTDGPKTGTYRAGETLNIKQTDNISRADVADFMLKSAKDNKWVGKIVVVAY
ncbi:MAG: NAD(P)H-binding protein [Candidatus Diapherotrites archaeon]|nr:NAD(P)H-binding protein [Candidatus Diapherotrites archaeon]